MQTQISTKPVLRYDSFEYLLDAVHVRMLECISPCAARVSKKSSSALDAAAYHLCGGGQRVRAKLAVHAGLALGLTMTDVVAIAATVELLHNASLIHDDIQDHENMRRGQETVWKRFGLDIAICAGDLLLSAAYAALSRIENPRVLPAMISLMHERTAAAIDGQCADLTEQTELGADNSFAIIRYERIAMAKSGALLCLPIELALLAAGQASHLPDARHAVEAFAISYQIVDDLNDIQSDTAGHAGRPTFNILSIYNASGFAEESIEKAKRLGLHHIASSNEFAARLPCGAGTLLIDYANGLRKLLIEQNQGIESR